jgi:surface antigen
MLHWPGCVALLLGLALAGCGSSPRLSAGGGSSEAIECAPYARQTSGIQLFGDAAAWWDEAAGRYPRSDQPQRGAVLVFRRSGRLPYGHVSVVSGVSSGREIIVTQANWVHHRIARAEPVVDVSSGNDWSAVRVWWAPSGALGTTVYPTFGFIGPAGAQPSDQVAAVE